MKSWGGKKVFKQIEGKGREGGEDKQIEGWDVFLTMLVVKIAKVIVGIVVFHKITLLVWEQFKKKSFNILF